MKKLLLLTVITLSQLGFAHDGHDIPGALPPAPHGGVVKEAEHTTGHLGKHTDETELFFEVVYANNEIKVYPLALQPNNTKTFVAVAPKTALSNVELKAEVPRTKKVEKLTPTIENDFIKAAFDSKGANRFIVHVGAQYEKEMKLAKVQIEKK